MRTELIKALIRWIEILTSVVTYMAEHVPQDMRIDLHNARYELVEELKKIRDV